MENVSLKTEIKMKSNFQIQFAKSLSIKLEKKEHEQWTNLFSSVRINKKCEKK